MRNITTLALCTLVLSGCATAVNTPFASTRLILNMRVPTSMGVLYAMKNSPGFEKCYPKVNTDYGYSILGGHCAFKPKDTPDKIVIEYARFMSSKESVKRFYGHQEFADNEYGVLYYSPEGRVYSGEYGGRTAYTSAGKQRQAQAIA